MLYQPVRYNHAVSCCRSAAEHQYRSENVVRTDFHELVRDSARCLAGEHPRLSPDGFWCQNHRESDPAYSDRIHFISAHDRRRYWQPVDATDKEKAPHLTSGRSHRHGAEGKQNGKSEPTIKNRGVPLLSCQACYDTCGV